MDDSRFLIVGANGQLGTALRQKYPQARAVDVAELDITDPDSVKNYDWSGIDTIINAAAYTNVDVAETEDGRVACWQVNAVGAGNLARAAIEHGLTLVHISTEYVFDGSKTPHMEDELFSPLSSYGASKAAADVAVGLVPDHFILRTSWLIGEGKNFVRTMLELGKNGTAPTVVADQIGRLTFTAELVGAIDHLLQAKAPYGTYNVSGGGEPASWADITRQIFQIANFSQEVTDTTTADYYANKPDSARRPLHSAFDLSKIKSTGLALNDWQQSLKEYVKKELEK